MTFFLQVNQVYYICNGIIKLAPMDFSSPNNPYEITFNENTRARLCNEMPARSLPFTKYHFLPLQVIHVLDPNSMIGN